jgi:hypothetical protein
MSSYIKILESRILEIVDILEKKPKFQLFDEKFTESSFKQEMPSGSYVKYKSMNHFESDMVFDMIKEMKNKVSI